jgi:hypothetical protein
MLEMFGVIFVVCLCMNTDKGFKRFWVEAIQTKPQLKDKILLFCCFWRKFLFDVQLCFYHSGAKYMQLSFLISKNDFYKFMSKHPMWTLESGWLKRNGYRTYVLKADTLEMILVGIELNIFSWKHMNGFSTVPLSSVLVRRWWTDSYSFF